MGAPVQLKAQPGRRGVWRPNSVSVRLTSGLCGLFLLSGLVAGGAIFRLHTINMSMDHLIDDDFDPLIAAEDLVQRVQMLVALTPKLLNARDTFELDNLSSQIVDMFNLLDRSHARIKGGEVSDSYDHEITRHQLQLYTALAQLTSLVHNQLQLNADMSRVRRELDVLLTPNAATGATPVRARQDALAAMLYQTSLAMNAVEISRNRAAVKMLFNQMNDGALPLPGKTIRQLIDGDDSIFALRQNQLDLKRRLQGEAGNTNLRANQLVYAVANLSAAMRHIAQVDRLNRHAEVGRTTVHLAILFTIAALIAAGLVAYLRLSVLRRLIALRDSVLLGADSAAEPLTDDRADEIGDLSRSLQFYVAELKSKGDELRTLAATDPLTGLPNRRDFMARGKAEVARRRGYGSATCVLMIDIDHFKRVNDTWGHTVGDRVICEVASIGLSIFRGVDVIGRIGGEEFAVVMAETGEIGATAAAQRMRCTVEAMRILTDCGNALSVTVSIGLALMIAEGETLDQSLGRADHALYEAKRSGRNRVCIAAQEYSVTDHEGAPVLSGPLLTSR